MAFEILTSNQGILETRMREAIVLKPLIIHPKHTAIKLDLWFTKTYIHTYIYVNPLVIGNERILSPSLLVYCAFCFLLRAIDNKLEGGDWGQPKIITQELDTSCVCVQDQESMQLIFLSQSSWNRSDFLFRSHYWRKTGLRNHQIQTQQSYKGPSASD